MALAHLVVRQERRRAAAVQLRPRPRGVEAGRLQREFALEPVQIRAGVGTVLRRHLVAAGIEPDGVAERNVEVEREILRRGARVSRGAPVVGRIEIVAELKGGWIGRIPWAVRAVPGEQVGAKEGVGDGHGRLDGGATPGSAEKPAGRLDRMERGRRLLSVALRIFPSLREPSWPALCKKVARGAMAQCRVGVPQARVQ